MITQADKIKKLKEFNNEAEFRMFLVDLLKKMGFKDVQHTHQYGTPEYGKDIIAIHDNSIEGEEWYAFVVKYGKIMGGTNDIETIKNQIRQAFEYEYGETRGSSVKMNKVKVVTNDVISSGAKDAIKKSNSLKIYANIDFWSNEEIIQRVDTYLPDFWLPGDEFYKEYTKSLDQKIRQEFELKDFSLKKIEDKTVKKLLDIFISPNISESVMETKVEDGKEAKKELTRKKVPMANILDGSKNILIAGDPGSGKTKVINNLLLSTLKSEDNNNNKILPIPLKGKDIKNNDFDLQKAIEHCIKSNAEDSFAKINLQEYKKILFVDEIDTLTNEEKIDLLDKLNKYTDGQDRFIITQRKNDNLDLEADDSNFRVLRLNNFNFNQVDSFIQRYFEGTDKGERFIQVLRESNLLSKLPTTPLTITLISLLHDETGYEIPATLTDIYEEFTQILIGKLKVRNRTDLLLFTIKKRLFTYLALNMLEERRFEMPFSEFSSLLNSFLSKKGFQQQSDIEFIEIINNSGVLFLDHLSNVGFKQQAFIEYFASVEIYDHSRNTHYTSLVEKFNDVSWQNTAIFFAGKSKDFPTMISDVINKMPNTELRDWFINTGGMGYLSQALYLTDKEDRKKLIYKSLDNMQLAFQSIKDLTKEDTSLYKDFPLPLIAHMLVFWFNENFKSNTLKQPLTEVFTELCAEHPNLDVNEFNTDFKLLLIAATLSHKNIGEQETFLKLIDRGSFIKNPVLMLTADMFLESAQVSLKLLNPEIKKNIEKQIRHHIKALKNILKEPAYRFNDEYRLLDKHSEGIDSE